MPDAIFAEPRLAAIYDAIEGERDDAMSLPELQVDLAAMTGNVGQVILADEDWSATLRGAPRRRLPRFRCRRGHAELGLHAPLPAAG